jgi:hypothetical protein
MQSQVAPSTAEIGLFSAMAHYVDVENETQYFKYFFTQDVFFELALPTGPRDVLAAVAAYAAVGMMHVYIQRVCVRTCFLSLSLSHTTHSHSHTHTHTLHHTASAALSGIALLVLVLGMIGDEKVRGFLLRVYSILVPLMLTVATCAGIALSYPAHGVNYYTRTMDLGAAYYVFLVALVLAAVYLVVIALFGCLSPPADQEKGARLTAQAYAYNGVESQPNSGQTQFA